MFWVQINWVEGYLNLHFRIILWITKLISFQIAPKLTKIGHKRNQTVGSIFQVLCTIEEGSHPIFFEWFKNSVPLKSSPEVNYKIENSMFSSTFMIVNIDLKDAANYSCFAKNSFGSDSYGVILNINGMFALISSNS